MKLELQSASNFLVHLIRLSTRANISESQLEKFRLSLVEVLRRRYRDHWFLEKPFKGSGYRCIRINGRMDPVIGQATEAAGLNPQLIHSTFPSELTMWIDPLEVSYRIGENGSICVLYEYKKDNVNEPWKPNSTSTLSSSTSSNANSNKNHAVQNTNAKNLEMSKESTTSSTTSSSSSSESSDSGSNGKSTAALVDNNGCKDKFRRMDYLLDPRKSVSIEQLAAYVSS